MEGEYRMYVPSGASRGRIPHDCGEGNSVTLRSERFRSPELLFQPSLFFDDGRSGLGDATYQSIMTCDVELRQGMFSNVVLLGSTTLFLGLAGRIMKELNARDVFAERMKSKIEAPP